METENSKPAIHCKMIYAFISVNMVSTDLTIPFKCCGRKITRRLLKGKKYKLSTFRKLKSIK